VNGYDLGELDNKCSKIKGCALSENENKCLECDNFYYCLDKKTGKCEINDEIIDENKKFYFKCNKTNDEGLNVKNVIMVLFQIIMDYVLMI
jgi:hypothetical protein